MMKDDSMMTVKECAEILKCNPRIVRESIENGSFPFGICVVTKKKVKVYKISKPAFNRWYYGETVNAG